MAQKILILGASGFVGASVTKQLLADGFSVRTLVRNADKARALLGDKVEIMVGDFSDKAALAKALADVDAVNLSVPWQFEADVAKNVTAILAAQGRKNIRVSYISGITALPENRWFPMINEKLKAEEALKKSGVAYTIFRPSWFMDALASFVRDGRATLFGRQKQPCHFIALADFSRAVSRAHQTEEAVNQTFVLSGSEAIPMLDALQKYCDVAHPGMKAASMPIWLGNMLAAMMKSAEMKDFVQMMAYFDKSPKVSPSNGAEQTLGISLTPFAEWLKSQK